LISRALITVLFTGFVCGLLVSGVQMLKVIPLIVEAENYEQKNLTKSRFLEEIEITGQQDLSDTILLKNTESHTHNKNPILSYRSSEFDHENEGDNWVIEDGMERKFYTFFSNIVTGITFSLILVAVYLMRGKSVDIISGLFWGLMGFFVFSLAPSLGLPPKLPGATVAVLETRQLWWIFTVLFTACGIGLLTESKSIFKKIVAVSLIFLPQIIGAPDPHLFKNTIPTELMSEFVTASLLTSAFFWIVVGAFSGLLYKKLVQEFPVVPASNSL